MNGKYFFALLATIWVAPHVPKGWAFGAFAVMIWCVIWGPV